MFYSRSQNRHKRWYHLLSVGHKKLWALGIACAFVLVAGLTLLVVYTIRAAGYDMNLVRGGLHGSVLYDSQHRVITMLTERENAPVQWQELPVHLVQAFMAREDAYFFDHNGVVYSALLRSALRNILARRYKQGASTITMQLTRHVFELQGKTLDRKLLEIVLAQRLENNYDKHTIFCQYLSRIFFGQNCYGIREAARYYCNKSVSELTLEESAMLAGIVCAPSLFNPKRNAEAAHRVRRETLQRMLELQFITPEQYEAADAAPIPTPRQHNNLEEHARASYPAMWANAELEALPSVREELGKGVSAVSYLLPDLQQYLEEALQQTLSDIETPGATPALWAASAGPEAVKAYAALKRPAWLRTPESRATPDQGVLQCCALVLDARLNHRGQVLAVASGRNAGDGIDRWQTTIQPGRAIAPLVFCCACLPGGSSHHIVAKSASITGSRLGYSVVRSFFDGLGLNTDLPDQAHEEDLYNGLFSITRLQLAKLHFSLQNAGLAYTPRILSAVWSHAQRLLYAANNEPPPEYIRRESAVAVSHLPPFQYHEGEPTVLQEELPNQGGYWTMVCNDRGVAVFLWIGVEFPAGAEPPTGNELRKLIPQVAMALAKDLHTRARKELRAATAAPSAPVTTP